MRAIGVSHTACKDELRRNLRFHSWSVFSFFIISILGYYSLVCVSGGLRRLRVYCCRRVLWRAHPSSRIRNFWILQDLEIFGICRIWRFCRIFSAGSYCWSQLSAGGHTESTRLLIGPELITWALGCTFGTQLSV